ncbi:hypothetical protein J2X02_003724 [Pseudoxanthomonas japonensis]|uniref:hypothetical protein n=1 Tax=Pseudoxanthomonas japonensis TaxID=69284 RepID=UPI00285BE591|nr:hypothetical protein [Pseudoxanthomonas japonensis]MDR7070853.1 hypothetical protein [Pseudoxanthomonas japonensis]
MHFMERLIVFIIAALALSACTSKQSIEITAPLERSLEDPTIEASHNALERAAKNACPSGYKFDDSSVTYGAQEADRSATVTMKVWCN